MGADGAEVVLNKIKCWLKQRRLHILLPLYYFRERGEVGVKGFHATRNNTANKIPKKRECLYSRPSPPLELSVIELPLSKTSTGEAGL